MVTIQTVNFLLIIDIFFVNCMYIMINIAVKNVLQLGIYLSCMTKDVISNPAEWNMSKDVLK